MLNFIGMVATTALMMLVFNALIPFHGHRARRQAYTCGSHRRLERPCYPSDRSWAARDLETTLR